MIVSPLDAPALVGLGAIAGFVHQGWLYRRNPDWFVGLWASVVLTFWADLAVAATLGIAPWVVAPAVDTPSVVLATCYALAYPFWFWLGGQAVFLALGRRPSEGGVLWLYRIDDSTEEFDPSWES